VRDRVFPVAPKTAYREDTLDREGLRHRVWVNFTSGKTADVDRLPHPRLHYARLLDTDSAPGAERLLGKHGHNQTLTGCIQQMKTALTLGILY
jgi:hypothetical protein